MKNLIRLFVLTAPVFVIPLAVFAQTSLENPLNQEFSTIPAFIAGALKVLVMVALPIITLFVVVAGFMYIKAQGKSEALKEANRNFVYVLIGAMLILGAWVIATLIGGTVTQLVGK